jgi:hypothetical protein
MMLEKKLDAALFGLPGRTQMRGSLMPTSLKKPLSCNPRAEYPLSKSASPDTMAVRRLCRGGLQ